MSKLTRLKSCRSWWNGTLVKSASHGCWRMTVGRIRHDRESPSAAERHQQQRNAGIVCEPTLDRRAHFTFSLFDTPFLFFFFFLGKRIFQTCLMSHSNFLAIRKRGKGATTCRAEARAGREPHFECSHHSFAKHYAANKLVHASYYQLPRKKGNKLRVWRGVWQRNKFLSLDLSNCGTGLEMRREFCGNSNNQQNSTCTCDNREAGVLIEVVVSGIVFIKYVFHFRLRYRLYTVSWSAVWKPVLL